LSAEEEKWRKATVQQVCNGPHGLYMVTTLNEPLAGVEGSVTAGLEPPVWNEGIVPTKGTFVLLATLTSKAAGWRALHARFFQPEDTVNPP